MKTTGRLLAQLGNYKFRSLLFKNFLFSILLFTLPLMGITWIVKDNGNRIVREEISALSTANLARTSDLLDSLFMEANYVAASISLMPELSDFLKSERMNIFSPTGTTQQELDTIRMIVQMMKTFVYTKRFVYTIYVYAEQSSLFLTTSQIVPIPQPYFEDINWLPSLFERKDSDPYLIARPSNTDYGYFISVVKPIFDQNAGRRLGAIAVNIEIGKIGEIVALDKEEGDFSITTQEGNYLYPQPHPEPGAGMGSRQTDRTDRQERTHMVEAVKVSAVTDLRYEQRLSLSRFSAKLKTMQDFSTALALLSLTTALVASILMAWSTYRPIRLLMQVLEDPDPELLSDKKQDEIRFIATGLVRTIQVNKTLREEMQNQLSLMDRTRTAALQAQINPHFLYNTLDSIRWSVLELTGGENRVSAMIHDLARLLRLSMEIEEHAIPVHQEVEHACMFIRLLKVRYPDKFEVHWDVDDTIQDRFILKLCLQPIIENAYTHGIKPTRRKGKIEISGKEEQGRMVFRIQDNGRGIAKDRLKELKASFLDDRAIHSDHIGLANVNARIKLVFGPSFGLEVESIFGEGTQIVIRLP